MINLEANLFTIVATKLRSEFSRISITSEPVSAPPQFPCVSMVEMNNTTYRRSLSSAQKENHSNLTYEIQAYSNLVSGKKSECRAIMAVVDDVMLGLNFVRIMLEPITNLPDASVYRVVARYTSVAAPDGLLYRG